MAGRQGCRRCDKLGLVSEEMKEHQAITEEEIALQLEQRKVNEANADSQLEIAKLSAQSAEKDKYTAQERLKFIEEAAQKEREIADRNIEIARREYELLKRKSDLAENSAEENDALSQAYVKLQNAETDYFKKTRELSAQRVEAINQIKAETKANEKLLESKQALAGSEFNEEEDEARAIAEEEAYFAEEARMKAENEAFWQGLTDKLKAEEEYQEGLKKAKEEELQIIKEAAEREKEIEKEKRQMKISGLMDMAAATADILGSIADSMEVNNEKEFKRQQGLQIAQVTITTLAGAVGAFMQAMSSYPAPAGAIIGGIQAAAATAAGIAQISKIKQQKYSKNGSSSGAIGSTGAVQAPDIKTEMSVTRSLTSASEEDRMNRTSTVRAYIVDSDLQAKEQERQTMETETTF